MKLTVNPTTGLLELVGKGGGGGGGDGIKKINGVSPNSQGDYSIDFDESQFTVEKTANGLKVSLKGASSAIQSISLNGQKIPSDGAGNVALEIENGIEGKVE